jgi:hypothetical protein
MNKTIPEIDYKILDKIQDVLVLGASNRFDKRGGIIDKQSRLIYEYIYNNYVNPNFQSEKPVNIVEIADKLEKEVDNKTKLAHEEFAKKYKLKQYKPKTKPKKTKPKPVVKKPEIIEPIISQGEINE